MRTVNYVNTGSDKGLTPVVANRSRQAINHKMLTYVASSTHTKKFQTVHQRKSTTMIFMLSHNKAVSCKIAHDNILTWSPFY